MSIYANTYIIDENTGEATLVKHLNKCRIHRYTAKSRVRKWNKNGHACHIKREYNSLIKTEKLKIRNEMKNMCIYMINDNYDQIQT